MIAIDYLGAHGIKYGVFESDDSEGGQPRHPFTCHCLSEDVCRYWYFRPSPKQIEFFDARERYVLFGGGRGGGKTAALIWRPVQLSHRLPGSRSIIFRRTMGELKKTIINGFLDLPKGLYARCTEDAVTYENGSKTWFGSADDEKAVRKLLSGEYDLMEFDEWSEWPLGMWKFATGSCRSVRSEDLLGHPFKPQVVGGTNPGGAGGEALAHLFGCSGVKRQAIGEDPSLYNPAEYRFIQSLVSDNPAYAAHKPAGIAYREILNSQPRRIRAAWLEGRWDGFEGQYFDCLEEQATKISHDDFLRLIRKQHWAPRWISIDWGHTHHASVGWHALVEIEGRQYPVTYCTYANKGLGEMALAEEICDITERDCAKKQIVKIYLSPETFGETSYSRARRIGDVFVSRGLPRPVPANNKREDGWRVMHDLLRQRVSGVRLFPESPERTCSAWLITDHKSYGPNDPPGPLECLAQAVCDPKKDGDVMKDGDALHLDVNDQLRYGIASHISPNREPFADRVKDALADLPVEGNARYMQHIKMLKEEREKHSGVFYVGRRARRR
jgi:phage terminase large subunit